MCPQHRVLADIVALCANPVGTHPLSNRDGSDRLAGWNTLDVLERTYRVIFTSRIIDGTGVLEVLCAGPRKGNAIYDMANALRRTGRLTDDELTQIWQALALLDVLAEDVHLDGWDYRPQPAPAGMVKAAVAAGLLEEHIAAVLSSDEIQAAMAEGWSDGTPDPGAALTAAMRRARAGIDSGDARRIVEGRKADRCASILPRAGVRCIRRDGHPGAHRATP